MAHTAHRVYPSAAQDRPPLRNSTSGIRNTIATGGSPGLGPDYIHSMRTFDPRRPVDAPEPPEWHLAEGGSP